MYSLVVMAALTTGGEVPEICFGGRWGCRGGNAGFNVGCYACYGGGGCHGGWGTLHGYPVSWGANYGSSFDYCSGWGGGCYGGYGWAACNGGCAGGCSGGLYPGVGAYYGCSGWWGTCYNGYSSYGCHGCYGASYGPMWQGPGQPGQPVPPVMPPAEPPEGENKEGEPGENKEGTGRLLNRARLIVEVPQDARLFIDDQAMKATSARRTFSTPALQKGQTYYYILRAEVRRDGVTHAETRRVLIRAGDEIKETFTEGSIVSASRPGTATASK